MDVYEKRKVLIVEDETAIQRVLIFFLQHDGFDTLAVSNGEEAILAIPQFQPHLVILDLIMRPVSGWEVLQWLQAHEPAASIPVLIISALFTIAEQIRAFEAGAVEYLAKPTQPSVIVEHVHSLLTLDAGQRLQLRHERIAERLKILERIRCAQLNNSDF